MADSGQLPTAKSQNVTAEVWLQRNHSAPTSSQAFGDLVRVHLPPSAAQRHCKPSNR
jgi:hypothetical protein